MPSTDPKTLKHLLLFTAERLRLGESLDRSFLNERAPRLQLIEFSVPLEIGHSLYLVVDEAGDIYSARIETYGDDLTITPFEEDELGELAVLYADYVQKAGSLLKRHKQEFLAQAQDQAN